VQRVQERPVQERPVQERPVQERRRAVAALALRAAEFVRAS
jgi:hypothetical protein